MVLMSEQKLFLFVSATCLRGSYLSPLGSVIRVDISVGKALATGPHVSACVLLCWQLDFAFPDFLIFQQHSVDISCAVAAAVHIFV